MYIYPLTANTCLFWLPFSPADVTTGFAGCMRGIILNGQDLSLSESNRFEQVQFGGCPAEVVSGVRFMGEGMAEFQPYMAPIISVAFYFKTEQLAGVLFEVPCTHQPANNHFCIVVVYI